MAFAGLDRSIYPGDAAMDWLFNNTNLAWTGFYLPAPNHPNTSWVPPSAPASVRSTLLGQGWGFAPLYVGQQTDSHVLTASQGVLDAQDAANQASRAGFPQNAVIFLDIELGGRLPSAMIDYYKAWVQELFNNNYQPGVYCSFDKSADQLSAADGRAVTWVWNLNKFDRSSAVNPYPTSDPTNSDYAGASVWQLLQGCNINVNGTLLEVDLDSATLQDPSTFLP